MSAADTPLVVVVGAVRCCCVSFSGGRQKVTWFEAAVDRALVVDADLATVDDGGGALVARPVSVSPVGYSVQLHRHSKNHTLQ